MKLIFFLVKASWRIVLLAALVGAISGGASVTLVALITRTLRSPEPGSASVVGFFAALCAVVLVTQIGSNMLISRLTQRNMSELRTGMCRRILDSPLKHVEEIGTHRLLGALTGDVNLVSQAMNGVPVLCVNLVILICGGVYLATLSPALLLGALIFGALGVTSYWYSARGAGVYQRRSREAEDILLKFIRGLTEGVKELKMHHDRRREFMDRLGKAEGAVRESKFLADSLNYGAICWGRLMFFVAIGLLLFAWPRITPIDSATLTAYTITILYLMSPLEQIIAWLPFLGWAANSVAKVERMGLMLDQTEGVRPSPTPIAQWRQIQLRGVTHTYHQEGQGDGFVLGPLDLKLRSGEIVFIVGGNGSGKTTLGKLIAGLYTPEAGEIRLDGDPVTTDSLESYRQLFSVVFDDAFVFDNLWGLATADLDKKAGDYLKRLDLSRAVRVEDGALSTTSLSRGQRKRLALLTAYLEDRPIYVFDEWAADQDPAFRKVFYLHLLPELKRAGKTIVAITHDDRYFQHADRLVKLEEGQLVEDALQEDISEMEHEER